MAKRDKRNSRFSSLKNFYDMYKSGLLNDEQVKQHIAFAKENNGTCIFASEFEKFAEAYKEDIDAGRLVMAEFEVFMTTTGALKKSNEGKAKSGESSAPRTRLNTVESAIERGVAPENVDIYIAGVNEIYAASAKINAVLTKARVSFAIPVLKEKPEEAPISEQTT